jgi:hypothetical protein
VPNESELWIALEVLLVFPGNVGDEHRLIHEKPLQAQVQSQIGRDERRSRGECGLRWMAKQLEREPDILSKLYIKQLLT